MRASGILLEIGSVGESEENGYTKTSFLTSVPRGDTSLHGKFGMGGLGMESFVS